MIRKILKWTGLGILSIVIIVIVFYAFVYFKTESRINKEYAVTIQPITIPSDPASYAYGKHIAENRGCMGCHGNDLSGGRAFLDEKSPLGVLHAANITSGKGGLHYKDEDWLRVLRHGINRQNKSVWFMPSHDMAIISNEELGQLISYVKNQAPVDKEIPAKSLKPVGRVLVFFNKLPLLPAEMINHNADHPDKVKHEVSAEYGHYLATTCQSCHGVDMKGAPAHSEKEPPIPNISSSGRVGNWSDEGFINTLRTGRTPEGKELSEAMPWKVFTYTDDELKAIHLYLRQLK